MKQAIRKFRSKVHPVVRFFQVFLAAISAAALYYTNLPEEWKSGIPVGVFKAVSMSGFFITFLLQFTERKKK